MPIEISIVGVLMPSSIPSLFVAILVFWLVDELLRIFGCYRFVWSADIVRVALYVIIFRLLLNVGI
jgi:hypothetical protein